MKTPNRTNNLKEIFTQIEEICVKKDLRFGQLMEILRSTIEADDMFYLGNADVLNWLNKFNKGEL